MKQATNISPDFRPDLALPGMSASGRDDYRINRQFQMMRFDGKRWVLFGPILTDDFVPAK